MRLEHTPVGARIAEALRNEMALPPESPAEPWTALSARCLELNLEATVRDVKLAIEHDLRGRGPAADREESLTLAKLLRWCRREHPPSQSYTIEMPRLDGGVDRFIAEGSCEAVEDEPGTWCRCCTVMLWRFDNDGELEGVLELLCQDIASGPEPETQTTLIELAYEQAFKHAALVEL